MTRVLLVEPDAARRDRTALSLRQARFEVRSSGDAEGGLRLASEACPDVAVVDASLVPMPLHEFAAAVRAAAANPALQLVALLAPAPDAARAYHAAIVAGADDALPATAEAAEVVEAVRARERRLPPATTSAGSAAGAHLALERALADMPRPVTIAVLTLDDAPAIAAIDGFEALRELDASWVARLRSLVPEQGAIFPGPRGEAVVALPGSTPDVRALLASMSGVGQSAARVGGRELRLRATVGVATLERGHDLPPAEILVARARHALQRAARGPQPRMHHYADADAVHALHEVQLATLLQQALEQGAFRLVFQPKVAVADGRTVGAEALIRWNLPTTGEPVPAPRLLAAADDAGLLAEVGSWALREACRQCAAWAADGCEIPVSVNIAPSQLRRGDLVDEVRMALSEAALPGRLLSVEVPEHCLSAEDGRVRAQLEELRTAGTRVAVDDFGTGISSVALLRTVPADEIKVDRTVTARLPGSAEDRATLDLVLRHARRLGVRCVAEGIERPEQWALLAERGWDEAQGWHVAHPVDGPMLRRFAAGDAEAVAAARRPAR
jgi:EAL domain-containing protein (putative c-di-GMP-specific phosphodiesterase class I)/ActR/RegA family two-component response regulator